MNLFIQESQVFLEQQLNILKASCCLLLDTNFVQNL